MFRKISTSWTLAKESMEVLKQDKELMAFPVLSTVLTIILMASFFIPTFMVVDWASIDSEGALGQGLFMALTFAFYFIGYFVILFCNTALLHCAKIRFDGGDPTVGDGLRAGFENLKVILAWAAIGGTIGVILVQVEERLGFLGSIIRSLVGGAWTVVTYFAIPVLVFEKLPVGQAVNRSKEIIYKTWGEAAVAAVGMSGAHGLVNFAGFLLLLSSAFGAFLTGQIHLLTAGAVTTLIVWVGAAIVFSCLTQIYRAALYVYATTGEPPKAFATGSLESAFNHG